MPWRPPGPPPLEGRNQGTRPGSPFRQSRGMGQCRRDPGLSSWPPRTPSSRPLPRRRHPVRLVGSKFTVGAPCPALPHVRDLHPPRRPALDTPAHPSTCTSPSQSHFGVRVQASAPRWRPVCRSLLCREARPQQHRPPEASRTLTRAHAHAQSHDSISDVRASPQALPAFSEVPSSP